MNIIIKATVIVVGISPVIAVVLAQTNSIAIFSLSFFLNGAALSAQKITMEGALNEISNETNRALYSGIFGTLNLSLALMPLLSGKLIGFIGFEMIFIIYPFITFTALLITRKIICPIDKIEAVNR